MRGSAAPIDEAIAYGSGKPWSPELRDELVRRFAAGMADRAPLLRFFHENQPALRDSPAGLEFKDRMITMIRLVHGPDADFRDRLRATTALSTIHLAMFLLKHDVYGAQCAPGSSDPRAGSVEKAMTTALTVALEISARIEPAIR